MLSMHKQWLLGTVLSVETTLIVFRFSGRHAVCRHWRFLLIDVNQLFSCFYRNQIGILIRAVAWIRATKSGWWGSIPSRVIPETWRTVLPASCSILMGWCKYTVNARCCHWLATSAPFIAKATAWPKAQVSGGGRRIPYSRHCERRTKTIKT